MKGLGGKAWDAAGSLVERELIVLLAVLAGVAGTWAFIELAYEVGERTTQRFDDWAIRAMRRADDPGKSIGPEWLGEVGRDLTAAAEGLAEGGGGSEGPGVMATITCLC